MFCLSIDLAPNVRAFELPAPVSTPNTPFNKSARDCTFSMVVTSPAHRCWSSDAIEAKRPPPTSLQRAICLFGSSSIAAIFEKKRSRCAESKVLQSKALNVCARAGSVAPNALWTKCSICSGLRKRWFCPRMLSSRDLLFGSRAPADLSSLNVFSATRAVARNPPSGVPKLGVLSLRLANID
jgi:hypothetical protein